MVRSPGYKHTPTRSKDTEYISLGEKKKLTSFPNERAASAGSLGEDDPVWMIRGSLHKLNARVVLPVPHGLLEQGLVHPAEVRVYFVGNDGEVPNPLWPGRGRPLVPAPALFWTQGVSRATQPPWLA